MYAFDPRNGNTGVDRTTIVVAAAVAEVLKLDPNFSATRFVNAFLVRRNKKLLDDTLTDL